MAWDVVICPTKRGSLGIIDPICQSRAMMVKFIVRGLLPGPELWKAMLFFHMRQCAPKEGCLVRIPFSTPIMAGMISSFWVFLRLGYV